MVVNSLKNNLDKVDEKIILLTIIGSVEAIKNGGITIDEAEKFIFSPHMENRLKSKGCNEDIIELIMKGCELEDIVSLIPHCLNDVLSEIKQEALFLIKEYKTFDESFWIE